VPAGEQGVLFKHNATHSLERSKPIIGILTTKELDPPRDGRADNIWKLIRLLDEEPQLRVVLISLCPQSSRVTSRFQTITIPWGLHMPAFCAALGRGFPIQVAVYENPTLIRRLARRTAALDLDVIIADMARTSRIALKLPARRRILAMDDRLSTRYRRQAAVDRSGAGFGQTPAWISEKISRLARRFESPVLLYESKRLERFEERICKSFEAVVLVSETEARSLEARTGKAIDTVPNFVELPPSLPTVAREPATLLYFGNMSTAHNVDAAIYLARTVFPIVRRQLPTSRLCLVGRHVSPGVLALNELEGVSVRADAGDIAPFLTRATVGLFPLRFGSGIKTKILEALHARLPVVTTPMGAEGIPEAHSCMIICERPQDLADAAVDIMLGHSDVTPMVEAGVRLVNRFYSRETVRDKWLALFDRITG
jgi:glycosyl transferase family 1